MGIYDQWVTLQGTVSKVAKYQESGGGGVV